MSTSNSNPTKSPDVSKKPAAEEAWEDISLSGPQKWHVCEEGNTVEGLLLNRMYKKPSGDIKGKYFYRIQITSIVANDGKPTRVTFKADRDKASEEIDADIGDIVCVDERKDLEELQKFCNDGGKYKVRLTPIEHVKIGKGRSFWRFTKQKVTLKQPTRAGKVFVETSEDDSDVPF